MPSRILIISHNNHAFLRSELTRASECFDQVVFVAPCDTLDKSDLDKLDNVVFCGFDRSSLKYRSFASLKHLGEQSVRDELVGTIFDHELNITYVKEYLFYLAFRDVVEKVAIEYDVFAHQEDWQVLSMWYAADAYAAYSLKTKAPKLSIATLVHSYEVDPIKNANILRLFRSKYHNAFDTVSFISSHVRDAFVDNVATQLNLRLDNISVCHLGINKMEDGFCERSSDNVLRLLSCSHIVPVKRVELLFDALEQYADMPIEWFHIGSGTEIEVYRERAKNCRNPYLSAHFLGSLTNVKIHELYVSCPIDLFLNVSKSEGVPVSIMEAIAYGVPVCATDVGGNSEIVRPDFGCILEPDPTPFEIWKNVKSFSLMPIEKIETAREAARLFFSEQYDSKLIRGNFYKHLSKKA